MKFNGQRWSRWFVLLCLIGLCAFSCSRRGNTRRVFKEIVFIDHQNLRFVGDPKTVEFQAHEAMKNMDKTAEFGVDTYLFFAKETFEAMLNYDFEIRGIGNVGRQAFSAGCGHRQTGEVLRASLNRVLEYAKVKNLRVFFHSNQFVFPKEVLKIIQPAVWGTAVCPGRKATWNIYRHKLNEFLTVFPGVSGFQVTGDETQISVLECRCDSCRTLTRVDRVNLLTKETADVCQRNGKEVQMRTWQRMGELEREARPADMGKGLPSNVFFSIKNTRGDFHLPNPVDEVFLRAADPKRVIVEFDAWREYDGNNYFPCYMGDVWAPRFKLLKDLGVERIAVRLNWNSNKNPVFERPWGNLVNLTLFLKLAKQPERAPDDLLRGYIRDRFPKNAREAAFELYKYSSEFQQTVYYMKGEYCANHSKVQDEDAARNLEHLQGRGYLTEPGHFEKRRIEIQNACTKAMSLIDRMGAWIPETWRRGMREGVNVERYVSLGTIYKMEGMFWKQQNQPAQLHAVKTLLREMQNEWKRYHAESYRSMNGDDLDRHF